MVSRCEPPLLIEFARMNTLRAVRYTITLRETEDGETKADWRQVITGLSEEGDSFVRRLEEAAFRTRMVPVEKMLNHYLKTGRKLITPPPD